MCCCRIRNILYLLLIQEVFMESLSYKDYLLRLASFAYETLPQRIELKEDPGDFIKQLEEDHQTIVPSLEEGIKNTQVALRWGFFKAFAWITPIVGGGSYLLYRVSLYSPHLRHFIHRVTNLRGAYIMGVSLVAFAILMYSTYYGLKACAPHLNATFMKEVSWISKCQPKIEQKLKEISSLNDKETEKKQIEALKKLFDNIGKTPMFRV